MPRTRLPLVFAAMFSALTVGFTFVDGPMAAEGGESPAPGATTPFGDELLLVLETPLTIAAGQDLPVGWHIEGWSDLAGAGEFELVLLFTPGYRPSGAAVPPDYIYPGAELRIPVGGPDGTVTFQVTGDDQMPFQLLAGLLRVSDGELMSTASVSLPDSRDPQPAPGSEPDCFHRFGAARLHRGHVAGRDDLAGEMPEQTSRCLCFW